MKANERLLAAIGDVDERWIPDLTPKKKALPVKQWAIAGGGIAAALLIGFFALRGLWEPRVPVDVPDSVPDDPAAHSADGGPEEGRGWNPEPSSDGLPKITAEISSGGMGFEGLLEYSPDELENGNPWREIPADVKALPVYENLLYTDRWEEEPAVYETEEELRRAAEEAAEKLGMTVLSLKADVLGEIRGTKRIETVNSATAECEWEFGSATVYVTRAGSIRTQFSDPLPFGSEEERSAAVDILSTFLGYREAVIARSGEYNIYGERDELVKAYEDSDDPVQKLLNYSIAASRLYETEDGTGLGTVWKYPGMDGLRYLGDYPIITVDEALLMLLGGEYLTTVPADMLPESGITEDRIDRVELVYRSSNREMYAEPYYRFFVRLKEGFPASAVEGLSDWGAYYVPAVRAEYLAEIPVWDGGFN